jgi:tRNA (guanine10-N2)-methyltransferase
MTRYLCRFAQVREPFRLPELASLASLFNVHLEHVTEYSDASPFLVLDTTDDVSVLLSRSVLIKDIVELWTTTTSIHALHELLRLDLDLCTRYREASFRFLVKCFGATVSIEEQHELLRGFPYLNLNGQVILKGDCDVVFALFIDAPSGMYYFGKWIGQGRRELVDTFHLKKRDYLGTTSMDAELSLIMTNMARVKPNDLVYDPFVGTGSLMYPAASFGAFTLGSDIDGRQMRGKQNVSIYTNLKRYGVEDHVLGGFVCDFARRVWRDGFKFDAIITDPPYGVRAGAKRLGSRSPEPRIIGEEWRAVTYPETVPYELDDLIKDLLDFAAIRLVPHGRLVFWYPIILEDHQQTQPDDPCLFIHQDHRFKLIADCPQRLKGMIRRLLTLELVY